MASTATGKGAALVAFVASGTGPAVRSALEKMRDSENVLDYSAVADDTFDCSTAFANARVAANLKGHRRVYVPGAANNYRLVSTFDIDTSGVRFYGDGQYATKIRSESSGAAVSINTGLSGVVICDMQITRTSGTASSGKDGIKFNTLTEQARVENVLLSRHWIGLSLCATSYSHVKDVIARDNYSHGVQVANNASYAGLQWSMTHVLSQTNDGYGLYFTTAAGVSGASVGDIRSFFTYANKLGGVKFAGTSTSPINAIRWYGGFVGEDGSHGIELDTYNASNHKIDGLFAEIAGTSACGVDMSTAATNVGRGISVTANNGWVDLIGCAVVGNSYDGINISASRYMIVACDVRLNGAANAAGHKTGIRCVAGEGMVVGCVSKGHPAFGVFTDVDTVSVVGNDVRENTVGGYASIGAITNSVVVGNMGSTVNNINGPLSRDGVQLIAQRDTGWTAMTGTANESTAYATGSVTLVQLAERVKALQDALTAHGLIGA